MLPRQGEGTASIAVDSALGNRPGGEPVAGRRQTSADQVTGASPEVTEPSESTALDVTVPSAARLYDFYLGGHHNFAADRRLARRVYEVAPETPRIARMNREFLRRAVRYLTNRGIRQFIDIGCGLPTVGPVHDIAQSIAPNSRVVYVDNERVAVAHSKILLRDNDRTVVLHADLSDPEAIVDSETTRKLIDFDKPVAVLLAAVFHFVGDDQHPMGILERYRNRLKSGDYLVFSHASGETAPNCGRAAELYENTQNPLYLRNYHEIAKMLSGFSLLDPGLVHVPAWRPERPEDAEEASTCPFYAAVARISD